MDAPTLASLEAALAASPDNLALRFVMVEAYLARQEGAAAARLVEKIDPAALDDRQALAAVRALAAAGRPEDAERLSHGRQEPEMLIQRARLLLAADRRPEALEAYKAAVARNSALEDLDLKARLSERVLAFPGGGEKPKLRVISNDDTSESETRRLLHPEAQKVFFKDVGGLDEVKEQIRKRIILPFQKPSLFERFRKRVGGGILLYGPPGCGKTLLARATAGECGAEFFNVAIHDVLDMYIGESEQKLHALFEKARGSAPAVMFFDEIEALGGKRQYTREATSSKLVSQFLAEMDGFAQNNSGVLVLGATNVPWAVDPAFRRPGRFDRTLFVPPPDRPARRSILEILLRTRPLESELPLDEVAGRTGGFSGADLQNLVETAADEAIAASLDQEREVPIGPAQLRAALGEVKPTTAEWLTTARNYARYANEGGQYDEVLEFLKRHGK